MPGSASPASPAMRGAFWAAAATLAACATTPPPPVAAPAPPPEAVSSPAARAAVEGVVRDFRGSGDAGAALAALTGLESQHPGDVGVMRARVALLIETGRLDEAAAVLARAHDLPGADPDTDDTALLCGLLLRLGDAEGAVRRARTGLARRPDKPVLLLRSGISLRAVGDAAGARAALARAAELAPTLSDVRAAHGVALGEAGRAADAWAALKPVLDQKADADLAIFGGRMLLDLGDPANAAVLLGAGLTLAGEHPERARILYDRAAAYARMGRKAAALETLEASFRAGRRDPGGLLWTDPDWRTLRNDAAFVRLLRRYRLGKGE